jgi:hypothetical protein
MMTLGEWLRATYEVEDGEQVVVRKDGQVVETHEQGGKVSPELFAEYREYARGQ